MRATSPGRRCGACASGAERGRSGLQCRELLAQREAATVLQAVHGVLRATDALGDLAGGETEDEAHDDDLALLLRELADRLAEIAGALAGDGGVLEVGGADLLARHG